MTQTAGALSNSKDTSTPPTVSVTSLSAGNFTAGKSDTLAGDYVLPTTANGAGTIAAKTLSASIIADPTKTYDGTTALRP